MKVNHTVGYNSQRDNFSFENLFSSYKQCFSTSAWMYLSHFSKLVDAKNDDGLAWYLDQTEASIGQKGIAEKVITRLPYIPRKGSTFWWDVHIETINYVLKEHAKRGKVRLTEGGSEFFDCTSWRNLIYCLKSGPVIVGTSKIGGLPGGHIVLVTGVTDTGFILNDPFGNPLTGYRDTNGEQIEVPEDWFVKQCERASEAGKVRFIGWKK